MNEISIGNVVKLKSGGPLMTVESFAKTREGMGLQIRREDRERVNCQWFQGTELRSATFTVSSLSVHDDKPLEIYKT